MAMREQISAGLDVVSCVAALGRFAAWSTFRNRGMEGDVVSMQDIFVFRKTGISEKKGARSLRGDGHPAQVRGQARGQRRERSRLSLPRRAGDLMDTQLLIPSVGAFLAVMFSPRGPVTWSGAGQPADTRQAPDVILLGDGNEGART